MSQMRAHSTTHNSSSSSSRPDQVPLMTSPEQLSRVQMSTLHGDDERKISFGIGGAGNWRRRSEAYAEAKVQKSDIERARVDKAGDGDSGSEAETRASRRRRSSSNVWSRITPSPGSSPIERVGSIMGFFRRGSKESKALEQAGEDENDHVRFSDVDWRGHSSGHHD